MTRLVLGVIGHVDHGKTALVRALTGMETDRLAEEQARGISIALGFAHLRIGADQVDFIDMPGHERFVRTMVSGATGIDAVLLVADAREGIMPQTREHIDIASLLGVRRAVIAVTRADLAEAAQVTATARAVAALAARAGLLAAAPVACSAVTGEGLAAVLAAITAELAHTAARPDEGAPWLPVDRAFSIAGHGTVVTGTLRGGTLATGDTVEIVPAGTPARIRALQVHGRNVAAAQPGWRVAVNLRGIEPSEVARGAALAAPGLLAPAAWLSVRMQAVADAPALPNSARLRLLFGTQDVGARLRLLDADTLEPGGVAFAQLHCDTPVSLPARARFVLRTASPPRTVAGGEVLDPQAGRERRRATGVLAWLDALAGAAPAGVIACELARAGAAGTSLARLARLSGLGAARTASVLADQGALLAKTGAAIGADGFAGVLTQLPRALAAHPDGVARAALAGLLPATPAALLDEAANRLLAAGTLARDGALLRVPRPDQDARRTRDLAAQAARLAIALRTAGLSPPDQATLAPDLATRRLLDQLVRAGIVVRAPDRVQKREILFHRDAIEQARRTLAPLLGGEGLLVGDIGAALGISRKFSVPLLEHLDSVHFTKRVAERRVLAEPR